MNRIEHQTKESVKEILDTSQIMLVLVVTPCSSQRDRIFGGVNVFISRHFEETANFGNAWLECHFGCLYACAWVVYERLDEFYLSVYPS
jgi:hypothetical protein